MIGRGMLVLIVSLIGVKGVVSDGRVLTLRIAEHTSQRRR